MPHIFCVYGHLTGLDQASLRLCQELLSGYECTAQDSVLDFIHEGHYIDAQADLDALVAALPPTARGIIDIIDHMEWEMFRCTVRDKALHTERIALDNALDTAYATER
ncbi:MAG: hypothetical protein GX055_00410 [Desulfovibrionales bacterium]|nr:hypothetical protein [Desulfovibrionales bacterium]